MYKNKNEKCRILYVNRFKSISVILPVVPHLYYSIGAIRTLVQNKL